MANAREIQGRIKSISDTKKITSAMYMISSTKLRKAKQGKEDTEPYFFTLQSMITRTMRHIPDMDDIYFEKKEKKPEKDIRRGVIVVTADKGLAGAYNHNVLKLAQEWLAKEGKTTLYVVGELGRQFFAARNIEVEEQFQYTAQNPTMHRARRISGTVLESFRQQELDEVWLIYTDMINSMQTQAQMVQLLPLQKENFKMEVPLDVRQEEFLMQPSPGAVLHSIVPNYLTGYIFGALVESFCSEQNARMVAMQAASDNASDMLRELNMEYNRVRQAAITQEITEVISGAKAQKKKKQQQKKKKQFTGTGA